jgi:hypothetical protein
MFDNLPEELRKYIFLFLEKQSQKCHLCNFLYKRKELFKMNLPEQYIVCKRCWIGY